MNIDTVYSLKIKLGEATTTTAPSVVCSYSIMREKTERGAVSGVASPQVATATTDGVTEVPILSRTSASALDNRYKIDSLYVCNRDTVAHTVYLYYETAGNSESYITSGVSIAAGATLQVASDGTISRIPDSSGTLSVAEGGTGATSFTDGAFLIGNGTNAVQVVGPGTAGQIPISQGAGADPIMRTLSNDVTLDSAGVATIAAGAVDYSMLASATITSLQRKNRLRNPTFSVAQRGTSFTSTTTPANNDDTYLLDGWYMLTDGNDVFDVTQQLSGDEYEIRLDVETINKKGGIAQIIEYKDCQDIISGTSTVTFSFQAKVSSTTKLDNIKAAIVSWSGTADTVTSDIISAWNVEGTNPTLIANATYENTPANLSVTTSYATYSVSAAIDTASTKNIIVMIWSDVTDTTLGDFIHIRRCQLELGTSATPFEFRPFQQELALCQRYCYVESGADGTYHDSIGYRGNGSVEAWGVFPVTMRVTPTSSTDNVTGITAGVPTTTTVAAVIGATGAFMTFAGYTNFVIAAYTPRSKFYNLTGTTFSGTAGDAAYLALGPDVKLIWDAEL